MYKTEIKNINLGGSNSYIVKCDIGCILVDAGIKGAGQKLREELNILNLKPEDVRLIIITHNHYDHTQGLAEVRELTKAPVVIHKNELNTEAKPNNSSLLFKIIVNTIGKLIPDRDPVKINPDIEISDEFGLGDYGIEAKIIHTPGHSPGSVCIIMDDKQCIAGDTLFNMFPGTHYPIIVNDKKNLIETYRLLDEIDSDLYYPGHGKPITRAMFKKRIMNRKKYFKGG